MNSSDSEHLSEGGDAVEARKRAPSNGWRKNEKEGIPKKQKTRKTSSFPKRVLTATGLILESSGRLHGRLAFKCCNCGYVCMNMLSRWQQHANKCRPKSKMAMQVQTPLVLVLNAATEIERKRQVDTYLVAYWIYKYKMSFTTGDKTHEVPPPPPHFIAILYVYFYFDTFICDIVCVRLQLLEQLHCTDKKQLRT